MTTRTITIDLKTILDSGWAYGTVSFEMITDVATSGASIYPQSLQKVKMDVDGIGSVNLAVPDTGAWVYEVRLPSTQESQIVVEDGAAVTLAELLETGLTPVPPSGDSYWVRLDGTNTPMTGELLLSGDPVSDAGAATKQTVDTKQDKDTDATASNAAIFDANGQTVDAGFALGTAAQSDAGDFDTAGSAAAVAGDLTTHEGLTGTAVHGLGSASTADATDFVAVTGDTMTGNLQIGEANGLGLSGRWQSLLFSNYDDYRSIKIDTDGANEPPSAYSGLQLYRRNGWLGASAFGGLIIYARDSNVSSGVVIATGEGAGRQGRLYVKADGLVGINELTPSAQLHINGNVKIMVMKSGATQAAAGAAAGELWKTTGHATLPDNVVLHGV